MKVFHSPLKGKDYTNAVSLNSVPALYERYINNSQPAVDEWTLSLAMSADTANGGLNQLEDHYNTFIVCLYCTTISHCWLKLFGRLSKILRRSPALV
jgi:hypothetical protein